MLIVLLATVLCVATPIKIWNNARIEHRLQEQEKLLLAAQDRGARQPDQPALPVQHADLDLVADPHAAGHGADADHQAVGPAAPPDAQHRITSSRCARSSTSIDEYLDIEVVRFGPQLAVEKQIAPTTLDVIVPSMMLQPLVENSIKHGLARKVGGGRITITQPACATATRSSRSHDDGLGMTEERLEHALGDGIGLSNVNERLRVIYGADYQLKLTACRARARARGVEIPELVVPERVTA